MADATATSSLKAPRIINVEARQRPLRVPGAPTPLPTSQHAIQAKRHRDANLRPIDQDKARAARLAKHQQWASLNLRQRWADEQFMRGHLREAGVKVGSDSEPATVPRMKTKLRAVGIHSPEIQDAIGMPLGRFLQVNPGLPLWAALALVLEGISRFTPEGFEGGVE